MCDASCHCWLNRNTLCIFLNTWNTVDYLGSVARVAEQTPARR